jgi:hypothetical protein
MTAQISDKFVFRNKKYELIGLTHRQASEDKRKVGVGDVAYYII